MKVSKDTIKKEIVVERDEDVFTIELNRNEAKVIKSILGKMSGADVEEAIDSNYDDGLLSRSEYQALLDASGVAQSDNLIYRIYIGLNEYIKLPTIEQQ